MTAPGLHHAALAPGDAAALRPLSEALRTDRDRVAALLQAAALVAHLEHASCHLPDGWSGARMGADGVLRVPEARPGALRRLPQELLLDFVARAFRTRGASRVAGRGEARRAVRHLQRRWRQALAPLPSGLAVGRLLEEAPFLWGPEHAAARRALAAEHHRGEARHLWVAGPGAARRRLLDGAGDLGALEERLAGKGAADAWYGAPPAGLAAEDLAEAGRWSAALAAWRRDPPADARGRRRWAESWFALGRYERALVVLDGAGGAGEDEPAAQPGKPGKPGRAGKTQQAQQAQKADKPGKAGTAGEAALRSACLLFLGRPRSARRVLETVAGDPSSPAERLALGEVEGRLLVNAGRLDEARDRVAALAASLRRAPPLLRHRAGVLAAQVAWAAGDLEAVERHLEAARELAGDHDAGWRWRQAAALLALERGDAATAAAELGQALLRHRRRLRRQEAAGLWNDLGLARVRCGDLAGAERAFTRALAGFQECDGPREATLGLANLAEVRLRRGRVEGVPEILERTAAAHRAAAHVRGIVADLLLWCRLELLHGRAEAARSLAAEAAEQAGRHRLAGQHGEARVLAARALGWLGRPADAAVELDLAGSGAGPGAGHHLEPEERPALHALAGRLDDALRAAGGAGPAAALWRALATGREAPAAAWEELAALEPYRAARTVFDAECLRSGTAPAPWRRRAAATLRRLGAALPAERLEAHEGGLWQAVADHLASPAAPPQAFAGLLAAAGHPEARLWWESAEDARVLVAGTPPDAERREELAAPAAAGRLVLRARTVDAALRALFQVARREAPRWLREERDAAYRRPAGAESFVSEAGHDPSGPWGSSWTGSRRNPSRDDRSGRGLAATAGSGAGRGGSSPSVGARFGILGDSPALAAAVTRAARLAPAEVPLLVLGESGTGKELVARAVHGLSRRREGPLVAVNCAALSETLVLSDLFGHVRGAFTGADRDRAGVFETAAGGTVFLDEIGDLPAPAQGMLLRVLQEGEVRRLGESLPRRVDVRVVTATHRDLAALVADGGFRQDLYYRLKGAVVTLPPLRERGDDLLLLADHLLAPAVEGPAGPRLSAEARHRLRVHPWPGNVRELQQVLAVPPALAPADGDEIRPEHLDLPPLDSANGSTRGAVPAGGYHQQVETLRRRLVTEALHATGGHQSQAAHRLGLSRQAMSYLVRELGIEVPRRRR